MRKIAILGAALLATALVGCGKNADEQKSETEMAPASQMTAPAAAPEAAPMTEHSGMSMEEAAPAEGTEPAEGEPAVAE